MRWPLFVLAAVAAPITCALPQPALAGEVKMDSNPIRSPAASTNAATALLYRWWGLVEGPPGTDIAPFFTDLFADDVHVKMTNVDVTGIAKVRAGFAAIPKGNVTAHHVKAITVSELGAGEVRLEASFIYQTLQADGTLRSGEGFYDHRLRLRPDGAMVFTQITAHLGNKVDFGPFKPEYVEHRAKAVILQFQAVLDANDGHGERLAELIAPDATFANLLTPPKNGVIGRSKAVLRGADELAQWANQGPRLFRSVSHSLETFTVKPLGGSRYEVVAQFDWRAETHDGHALEKHTPRTWILRDNGGKYMQIEKLL